MSGNERAVLVALVAATGGSEASAALCAALLDGAAEILMNAPAGVLIAAGGGGHAEDRLEGLALLSEICGQCRLCDRGRDNSDEAAGPGTLGPIGAHRWR